MGPVYWPVLYTGYPRADPGFFLGGGALVSCSTSTPINHIGFFFFCRGAHPLHPPPRSAPAIYLEESNSLIERGSKNVGLFH